METSARLTNSSCELAYARGGGGSGAMISERGRSRTLSETVLLATMTPETRAASVSDSTGAHDVRPWQQIGTTGVRQGALSVAVVSDVLAECP